MIKLTLAKSLLAGIALAISLSACQQSQTAGRDSHQQEQSEAGSGPR